jgi:putative endonuclease
MTATINSEPCWLYLLQCEGGSLYAGVALDVEQRFISHLLGSGARYTRAFPPVRVAAARLYPSRGEALRAEHALKKRPRARKLEFFDEAERAPAAHGDISPGLRRTPESELADSARRAA